MEIWTIKVSIRTNWRMWQMSRFLKLQGTLRLLSLPSIHRHLSFYALLWEKKTPRGSQTEWGSSSKAFWLCARETRFSNYFASLQTNKNQNPSNAPKGRLSFSLSVCLLVSESKIYSKNANKKLRYTGKPCKCCGRTHSNVNRTKTSFNRAHKNQHTRPVLLCLA